VLPMRLLRALAHLAAALGLAGWALAVGRWLRDPSAGSGLVALVLLGALVAVALWRLYGPRGIAALRPAPPDEAPPAPEPVVAAVAPPWFGDQGMMDSRVDVNLAGVEELVALPGVGPVSAQRIVDERSTGGPFSSVEDLVRVRGLGPAKVRVLAERARV
jgi:competence ComEA-like helix-hairpin-helix protein